VLYNASDIVPQQRIPPSEDFECEQHLLEPQEQPLPEPKAAKQ
jgi:hypothetical protein